MSRNNGPATQAAARHDEVLAAHVASRHIVAQQPLSASQAQLAKLVGAACVVCHKTKGLSAVHLASEAQDCEAPECVVPMCWAHRYAYAEGRLDLLGRLEPRWRAEIAHAVSHMGLITTYRRLTRGALPNQHGTTAH